MSTDRNTPTDSTDAHPTGEPAEFIADRLGEYRDTLERLAELDTELSEDAQQALELIDEGRGQS